MVSKVLRMSVSVCGEDMSVTNAGRGVKDAEYSISEGERP